jgi:hypothetical protein
MNECLITPITDSIQTISNLSSSFHRLESIDELGKLLE